MVTSFRIVALALLTVLVVATPAVAQKRPDFSGTWVEDESQRKSPYDKPSAQQRCQGNQPARRRP